MEVVLAAAYPTNKYANSIVADNTFCSISFGIKLLISIGKCQASHETIQ